MFSWFGDDRFVTMVAEVEVQKQSVPTQVFGGLVPEEEEDDEEGEGGGTNKKE